MSCASAAAAAHRLAAECATCWNSNWKELQHCTTPSMHTSIHTSRLGGELWTYLYDALTLPLASLWRSICDGSAPPGLYRAWFVRRRILTQYATTLRLYDYMTV